MALERNAGDFQQHACGEQKSAYAGFRGREPHQQAPGDDQCNADATAYPFVFKKAPRKFRTDHGKVDVR